MQQPNQSIAVTDSHPYPPIKARRKNLRYANMIIPALRQQSSELTAITGYLYQSWILARHHKKISELLMNLAKVEMHHIQMLGTLITLLGGDPKFANNACECWSGEALDYCKDLRQIFQSNLEAEEDAAAFYLETAEQMDDPYVCAVLNRIALDEQLHAKIFKDFLRK